MAIGDGIDLIALSPEKSMMGERVEDLNNSSLVLLLQTSSEKILLMGDAEDPIEKQLMSDERVNKNLDLFSINIEEVDILKVGHQGSRNGSVKRFFKDRPPEIRRDFRGH